MSNTQFAYLFFGSLSLIGVFAVVIIDFLHSREMERTERWKAYYKRGGQANPGDSNPPNLMSRVQ